MLSLLYGPYPWVLGYKYSKWSVALYASTFPTIWSLSISWIIFACVNGFGGIVNKVLSFELFRPLSRIIYMTYLVHGQVLIIFSGTRNKLIPLEASNLVSVNELNYLLITCCELTIYKIQLKTLLMKQNSLSPLDLYNNWSYIYLINLWFHNDLTC